MGEAIVGDVGLALRALLAELGDSDRGAAAGAPRARSAR